MDRRSGSSRSNSQDRPREVSLVTRPTEHTPLLPSRTDTPRETREAGCTAFLKACYAGFMRCFPSLSGATTQDPSVSATRDAPGATSEEPSPTNLMLPPRGSSDREQDTGKGKGKESSSVAPQGELSEGRLSPSQLSLNSRGRTRDAGSSRAPAGEDLSQQKQQEASGIRFSGSTDREKLGRLAINDEQTINLYLNLKDCLQEAINEVVSQDPTYRGYNGEWQIDILKTEPNDTRQPILRKLFTVYPSLDEASREVAPFILEVNRQVEQQTQRLFDSGTGSLDLRLSFNLKLPSSEVGRRGMSNNAIEWMKEECKRQCRDLEKVLNAKLDNVRHFPGLDKISANKLWCLCIDGRYQGRGKFPFDDEPFFMAGAMRGLALVLDGLDGLDGLRKERLTADYLETLHDAYIADTMTIENKMSNILIGVKKYRTSSATAHSFGLTMGEYCSEAGFREMCRKYDCRNGDDPRYGKEGHPVGDAFLRDPRNMVENGKLELRRLKQAECRKIATRIIDQYYNDLEQSGNNKDKKLEAIIRCCQDLEQAHLFVDGNIRTLSGVLNKLLLENGFKPTILHDPNVLDGMSVAEIKKAISEGQADFDEFQGW